MLRQMAASRPIRMASISWRNVSAHCRKVAEERCVFIPPLEQSEVTNRCRIGDAPSLFGHVMLPDGKCAFAMAVCVKFVTAKPGVRWSNGELLLSSWHSIDGSANQRAAR